MNPITRTDVTDHRGYGYTRTLSRDHIVRQCCAVSSIAAKEMFEVVGQAMRNARMKPVKV